MSEADDAILKVLAYITRRHADETQLLVFEGLDPPEEGLQVPAGTVEPGEAPEAACRREVAEESGLTELTMVGRLAVYPCDGEDEGRELRHVFHLEAPPGLPEAWSHTVTAGEEDQGMVFAYRWVTLATAAVGLVGNQGDWLHAVLVPADSRSSADDAPSGDGDDEN